MTAEPEISRRRFDAGQWARWKRLNHLPMLELHVLRLALEAERSAATDPLEEFGWACRRALVEAELEDRRGPEDVV